MKLDVHIDGDLSASLEAEIVAAEKAVTVGVTRTGEALKAAWRAQVTGAGLGRRLANAIRANRYPRSGESISAASLVFSRAAEITDAFDRGVLIRSKHGLWLAIPTPSRRDQALGGGGSPRRLGAEHRAAAALRLSALGVRACSSPTTRGSTRAGSRRRIAVDAGATDATGCTVVIFLLVPQVQLAKRLDLARDAERAHAALPGLDRGELGGREALTAGRLACFRSVGLGRKQSRDLHKAPRFGVSERCHDRPGRGSSDRLRPPGAPAPSQRGQDRRRPAPPLP